MENDLFDWDGWDEAGEGAYIFYNAKLKVPIGNYPVGMEFTSAQVDFQKGILELFFGNEVKGRCKLKLDFEVEFTDT